MKKSRASRKRRCFSKRQASFDYEAADVDDDFKVTKLQNLKAIDENDSPYIEKGITNLDPYVGKCEIRPSDRLKLAAIYDNDEEILAILNELPKETSRQRILAEKDERGQPAIFYALESRSLKVLNLFLLNDQMSSQCLIAANGESVLHIVTKMGHIGILQRLLERSFVAELINHVERDNGRAPLHLAAQFDHVDIAKELLRYGARLDCEDNTGRSPIFMAASKGHADMLKVFLEHEKEQLEDLLFSSRHGAGIYRNILHVALGSGDENTVQVCLEQDKEIVARYLREEVRHGDGYLIHAACKHGMEKCLLRIIEVMGRHDPLHFCRKDKLGMAPIHKAAIHNHYLVVRRIGSMSRKFVNETTGNQQTALVLAAQCGHVKVVEELLMLKAQFTTSDDSHRNVLHYAIEYPEIVKLLLQKKDVASLLINSKEKDGYTPVHNAALRGLCVSVRILLEHGADLNVFTNTSRSPLHCAVSSQCVDVVELVLANEPALINKADATGKTPLHTAASYGSVDVVKCLLDHGAIIMRDGNFFSALHIAAHKGHLNVVEVLVTFDKNSVDWKNKYGRTALITAASTCKSEVVKYLLDNGASIAEDHELYNCLDWSLIKNDKPSAMMMMCHDRWMEILMSTKHGTEGTMSKMVYSMPDVAYRVLCNSMTFVGRSDSKDHWIRYNFRCLQNVSAANKTPAKIKPLTAIKTMVRTHCHKCLCHPVCCKYLKAKWMEFGWKVHSASWLLYALFLISLNIYAFGIPTYKQTRDGKGNPRASVNAKLAMMFCLIFASVNAFKEITQLFVYKRTYFKDKVNYLEWVLYTTTFIFALPYKGKIAEKTIVQWQACSVALFFAWVNLVLYLRRFASYGIIVLMMRRICGTLMKVMSLLIIFLVAFAAAFAVIMNDRQGFTHLGRAMLTSATMTLGEFDFKQTFLRDEYKPYEAFYWLRIFHLAVFLVVMPIIIMNLLLALAIDDTSSIMNQARLQKHIQTAKMIIDIERKRSRFSFFKPKVIANLDERSHKKVNIWRVIWEVVFYGPDFASEDSKRSRCTNAEEISKMNEKLLDMMQELQRQNLALQNRMLEIQNEFTLTKNRQSIELIRNSQDKQHAGTQFRGFSESIEGTEPLEACAENKRKVWGGANRNPRNPLPKSSGAFNGHDMVQSAEQDILDDKDWEEDENNPNLMKQKELHNLTADAEDEMDEENDGKRDEIMETESSDENVKPDDVQIEMFL